MRRGILALSMVALLVPLAARAQGEPVRLSLTGPPSLTTTGALRCNVGQEVQLGLGAFDSTGQATALEQFAPIATSTDSTVVAASMSESAYVIYAKCLKDGIATITASANGVNATMQTLVGRARNPAYAQTARQPLQMTPSTQRAVPVGWTLAVNGQPLSTTSMLALPTRQGQGTAGDYFVAVDDLNRALGGTSTTQAIRIQGNTLVSLPITVRPIGSGVISSDSLDNFRPRPVTSGTTASVDSLDNFRPTGVVGGTTQLPITVKTGGVISTNVQLIDGKAYIPVSDLTKALGGIARLDNGQIDITAQQCATCMLAPTRSP